MHCQIKFNHMSKIQLLFFLLPLFCTAQQKEIWVDKSFEKWPQIALINTVEFNNGDRYIDPSFDYAGTGFLIDTGKDTLAATAKHVLWIARNKKSKTVQINDELKKWIMISKLNRIDSVVVDKLINEDSSEILQGPKSTITERDWIIFSIKDVSPNIHLLKPRYTTLVPGERVYMIACAYADSTSVAYEGMLIRKEGMDLLIEFHSNKNLAGSSGSPVIDANGHLIGILSSSTKDNVTGKNINVAVSTEYLYKVIHKKDNLNQPKKDFGELILKTVLEKGTKKAIAQYRTLKNNPENFYIYNLRSSNKNGLREVGKKLIEQNKIKEAIKILKFNTKSNPFFYINFNLLAKAYLMDGDKRKAIKTYRLSTKKYDNEKNNEAFKEIARLIEEN